jgi:hypothetical protein
MAASRQGVEVVVNVPDIHLQFLESTRVVNARLSVTTQLATGEEQAIEMTRTNKTHVSNSDALAARGRCRFPGSCRYSD